MNSHLKKVVVIYILVVLVLSFILNSTSLGQKLVPHFSPHSPVAIGDFRNQYLELIAAGFFDFTNISQSQLVIK